MFANVNGTKIFFDVEGLQYVPDGPVMREKPVCFVLHGGPGGDHANFLPDTSVLADDMQLIYIDDRNCGRSERGNIETSSMKQNSEDLEALRQYLGLGKIYLLGHSYGGMKTQQYMIDHGENLHGAIIVGTAGKYDFKETCKRVMDERATEEQKALMEKRSLYDGSVSYKDFMAAMASLYHYKYSTPEDKAAAAEGLSRSIKNGDVTSYQAHHDMLDFDFLEDLKKVDIPTLIAVGKYDHITTYEQSERLHESIKNSELHIIEEAAHEVFSDRPDYIFPCIREFVSRTFKPAE